MNAMASTASRDIHTTPLLANNPPDTRADPCGCTGMIAAFESAQGPRRKRDASDDDIVECLDAGNAETEPATMVQRIPV